MKKILVIPILVLLLLISACSTYQHVRDESCIEDVDAYYAPTIERLKKIAIPYLTENSGYFVYELGYISFVVEKKTTVFKITKLTQTDTTQFAISNDYIPLKQLFSRYLDSTFYYNIKSNEYNPGYMAFILCDSLGNVKLAADAYTMMPTKRFCNAQYGIRLPIDSELGQFFFDRTFDIKAPYGY